MEKEIDRLSKNQQKDGSFLSLSSGSEKFTNPYVFHSIFTSILILHCLNSIDETRQSKIIKQRIVDFLQKQKSKDWSFNYWARDSREYIEISYPDDLDDTFCALAALFEFDKKIITGHGLAKITNVLTHMEVRQGGPYRTWLVNNDAKDVWKDVDIAVNANIAYFLNLVDITLPHLTKLFDDAIANNKLTSPYYPKIFPIVYFLSRFYDGKFKNSLVKFLEGHRNTNPLDSSLIVLSLLNLNVKNTDVEYHVANILKYQKKGAWKPYTFYSGVNPKLDKFFYAGSSDLTAAFCIAALSRYQHLLHKKNVNSSKKMDEIHDEIIAITKSIFSKNNLQSKAVKVIDDIVTENTSRQITLLPYFFVLSLGTNGKKTPHDVSIKLGIANLLGWMAYTIYDDFFDNEGKIHELSIANISLRKSAFLFDGILTDKSQKDYVKRIFDDIDEANLWEVTNARYPKIPNWDSLDMIVKKSFGHALGPLCILFALGYSVKSKEVKAVEAFFSHFIIAKQLNDDAHDWQEDIKNGNMTPVVARLLKNLKGKSTEQKLQKLFWYEVIRDIANDILYHIDIARKKLHSITIIENREYLEQLLQKIDEGAQKALAEREQTIEFLKSYK